MINNKAIAVIGASGIFPEADNLGQFYENLKNGKNSVREIPFERITSTGLPEDQNYGLLGYLDRIDLFDHEFFKISMAEAEVMDPQQRFMLQLAGQVIENAGYGMESLRGSNTAVILSAFTNDYFRNLNLENSLTGSSFVGNQLAAIPAKISYFFDLQGPSYLIDTTCSSSLIAIYEACVKISAGVVDYAIAGGVNICINFLPRELIKQKDVLGLLSADGFSRAFDEKASGIGIGEGGGLILLKSLEAAVADGDNILAVIKGGNVNHDGNRATGFGAPSSEAHKQIIVKTWKDTGIEPESISCIEAHGTGTLLGDPIELKCYMEAFGSATQKKGFCPIGSVKTNIGHLGGAAGIASFLKILLGFKNRQIFASLHYNKPNPHIDLTDAAIYVNTALKAWEPGTLPRRACISSLGFTGTNVHVLLEEAPQKEILEDEKRYDEFLVTFSAKSENALKDQIKNIHDFLIDDKDGFINTSYVLNRGRGDYKYRKAFAVKSPDELTTELEKAMPLQPAKDTVNLVLLCSDGMELHDDEIEWITSHHPVFEEIWNALKKDGVNPAVRNYIFQYSMAKLLKALGIKSQHVIGRGAGNIAVSVIIGDKTYAQGLEEAKSTNGSSKDFDAERFKSFIQSITQNRRTVFFELGTRGKLAEAISGFMEESPDIKLFYAHDKDHRKALNACLAYLYESGVDIQWDNYYKGRKIHRKEIPAYSFQKKRCWPESKINPMGLPVSGETESSFDPASLIVFDSPTETEKALAGIWRKILKVEKLDRDDDFFELGGDSIMGMQIIAATKDVFQIDIDFEDMYSYSKFGDCAMRIDELVVKTKSEGHVQKIQAGNQDTGLLSFNQESFYYLYKLSPEVPIYNNMGSVIELTGPLNVAFLDKALDMIIERHSILRTVYKMENEKNYQQILSDYVFKLPVTDISPNGKNGENVETRIMSVFLSDYVKPFKLEEEISLKVRLFRVSTTHHYMSVVLHHIASDFWSMGIFERDFIELYTSLVKGKNPELPPLAFQYIDFARWQREYLQDEVLYKQVAFWKKYLGGAPTLHKLVLDRPRPEVLSLKSTSIRHLISREKILDLKELARKENVTLFILLLSAFKLLIKRITNSEDIVIGTPIAGRKIKECENLIGFFVNILPVRSLLPGNLAFLELVKNIHRSVLDVLNNQDLPFASLVEILNPKRNPNHAPIFQIVFSLQRNGGQNQELPDIQLKRMKLDFGSGTSNYDLAFSLIETDEGIWLHCNYSIDLFTQKTMENLLVKYDTLLENILKDPNQTISQIPLVTEEEKDMLIGSVGKASGDYDF
ncbi:MAG: hypothetical protein JW969_13460 [Spirochaetales bacterium]|nr:hypothetical protein [Spirochaetales bacterium]